MPRSATASSEAIRVRLLEATSVVLAQHGPRKLSLTDIASVAGVSRPTLYRHFASKDDLLRALATHEKVRFSAGLEAALADAHEADRMDRVLSFIVEFQQDYPIRGLVVIEPTFMLDQIERSLRTMSDALAPRLEDLAPAVRSGQIGSADLADLLVRTAMSHFLIRGDDRRLLRELRHVVGIGG